jgi:hypothetical protein
MLGEQQSGTRGRKAPPEVPFAERLAKKMSDTHAAYPQFLADQVTLILAALFYACDFGKRIHDPQYKSRRHATDVHRFVRGLTRQSLDYVKAHGPAWIGKLKIDQVEKELWLDVDMVRKLLTAILNTIVVRSRRHGTGDEHLVDLDLFEMHFTIPGFTYANALDLQNIVHDAAAAFDEVKEALMACKVSSCSV